MGCKIPKKLIKRLMQITMSALNIIASVLAYLGIITFGSPVIPLLFGVSAFAFCIYMVADVLQEKVQQKLDRICELTSKYKTDQGNISIKLEELGNFVGDMNSVRSELSSIREMQERYLPVGRTEPINATQTPRFTAVFNKQLNTIEVSEITPR